MVPVCNVYLKILHNLCNVLVEMDFQALNMLRNHPQLSSTDFSTTILSPSISE